MKKEELQEALKKAEGEARRQKSRADFAAAQCNGWYKAYMDLAQEYNLLRSEYESIEQRYEELKAKNLPDWSGGTINRAAADASKGGITPDYIRGFKDARKTVKALLHSTFEQIDELFSLQKVETDPGIVPLPEGFQPELVHKMHT